METEQPTVNTQVTRFKIDSTRAGEIEEIAKGIKTMFTSREDFVNECFHLWLKFFQKPEDAVNIQATWIPHYTDDMITEMEAMMDKKEFEAVTGKLSEQKAMLEEQKFEQSNPGFMWYKPDSTAIQDIDGIIKPGTKANHNWKTRQEFFNDAISVFITWWSSPEKAQDKFFEMWPYFPDESMDHWKNHKDYKQTFQNMEAKRRAWCIERKIDPDWVPGQQEISKVKRVERNAVDFQETITQQSDMQTISNTGTRAWNRLCTEREEKEFEIQKLDLSTTTADALLYDDYPLIWDFYTRFLPVKIVLTQLGNMIVDEDDKMVDYELFRDEAYDAALGLSDVLRTSEERIGRKRNKKLSTGLPLPPPFGIKDNDKTRKKVDASKERFKNHFIGMKTKVWTKRKNDDEKKNNWFDGALSAMGLAYFEAKQVGTEAPSKGGKPKWEIKIGLTELGKEFWLLPNPIIEYNLERTPTAEWKNAFYEEEVEFIRKKIIPRFPLENDLVKLILDRLKKISDKDNEDETYLTAPEIDKFYWPPILEWTNKKENEKVGHFKNIASEVRKNPDDVDVSAWRAATMGRLSELNLVEWRIGDKASGHMGISKFCLKKSKK
jgi:hypothetical protein